MIYIIIGVCGCGKTTVGRELAKKLNCVFADADEFHSPKNKQKMSEGQPLTDEDRFPWLEAIHKHIARLVAQNRDGVVTCSALKKSYRHILLCGMDGCHHDESSITLGRIQSISNETSASPIQWQNQGLQTFTASEAPARPHVQHEINNVQSLYTSCDQRKSHDRVQKDSLGSNDPKSGNLVQLGYRNVIFVHLNGSREVLERRIAERVGHFMPASLLKSQLDTLEPLGEDEDGMTMDIDRDAACIVEEIVNNCHQQGHV